MLLVLTLTFIALIALVSTLLFTEISWTVNKELGLDYKYRLFDRIYSVPDDDRNIQNLESFNKVANEHGLKYWVSEGSALGLIREEKLIAGDSDVDVGLYGDQLPILKQVLKTLLDDHGFRVKRTKPLSITRRGSYIDIDITVSGQPCMAIHWPQRCDEFMSTLEPFRLVQFRGNVYKVPSIEYIEKLYGADWRIPKKNFKPKHVQRENDSNYTI